MYVHCTHVMLRCMVYEKTVDTIPTPTQHTNTATIFQSEEELLLDESRQQHRFS